MESVGKTLEKLNCPDEELKPIYNRFWSWLTAKTDYVEMNLPLKSPGAVLPLRPQLPSNATEIVAKVLFDQYGVSETASKRLATAVVEALKAQPIAIAETIDSSPVKIPRRIPMKNQIDNEGAGALVQRYRKEAQISIQTLSCRLAISRMTFMLLELGMCPWDEELFNRVITTIDELKKENPTSNSESK